MNDRELPPVMTVPEVAGLLRVHPQTVYRAIWNGQLGAQRVGRAVRVRAADLTSYLTSGHRPSHLVATDVPVAADDPLCVAAGLTPPK